ncbi:MAG: GerAB/ArcD/ProY family transporter [Oscillospiraceae bacterium]|nr:GerAB/ArcD/ProY family transporter [Oscillospiraceae bacterium]
MDKHHRSPLSPKEQMALLFAALLAPAMRIIPRQTAPLAGAGGWLAPLLVLLPLAAGCGLVGKGLRRLPPEAGLAQLYRAALGPGLGKLAAAATGLWLLVVSASALRMSAESFVSSIYPDTDLWLFLISLILLAWVGAGKGLAALCRMGQIFFWALLVLVGLLILLASGEIRLYHIYPFWQSGWQGIADSALPLLRVMGVGIPLLFTPGRLTGEKGRQGVICRWLAAFLLILALLAMTIIGMFGWQTAARLQNPLFSMAKEITLLAVFERLEALVAAVWVFSDLSLQLMLVWTGTKLLEKKEAEETEKSWRRRSLLWAAGAAVLGYWIAPDLFALERIWQQRLLWWDIGLCWLLPMGASVLILARKRK